MATAAMIAGLAVTLIYIFLHKGWFFIPDTNSFTDADPLLGTNKSTSFGAIGAAINFAVAYIVPTPAAQGLYSARIGEALCRKTAPS